MRWVRGDLHTEQFEQWVYQQPFEEFRELIELNYRDPVAVAAMQERLAAEVPARSCYCAWPQTFSEFRPAEQHERWLAEVAPSFREGKAASMVVDGPLFSRRG